MPIGVVQIVRRNKSLVAKIAVICALAAPPVSASQGRGNPNPPPPPPLPPAPVTVVNPSSVDCYSGAGCLDPAFGTQGKVQQNIGGDLQYMHAMAIQPDGKIVAAGARWVGTTGNFDQSWVIGRFLTGGAIDTSFGVNGLVTLDVIAGHSNETPLGVAVQADGKIVVGGYAIIGGGGSTSDTILIRLSASGAFDPTFGTTGKVVRTVANGSSGGMVLQPDGRIVMVRNEGSLGTRVTRFETDGAVDKKFGSQGSRLVSGMGANAIALQSTGRIVIAGFTSSTGDAMLARLTSSGALDTSFGNNGSTVVDFSGLNDSFMDVAIASDDSIVAGGHAYFVGAVSTMHMAIASFTSSGALTTGFGSSGRVVLDMHGLSDAVRAVNVRADGRVEFAGWGGVSGSGNTPRNVIVGRLTTTGALDSSFGSGGVTETQFGVTALALATAVGPDGLLTVAGALENAAGTGSQFWMLARYFR